MSESEKKRLKISTSRKQSGTLEQKTKKEIPSPLAFMQHANVKPAPLTLEQSLGNAFTYQGHPFSMRSYPTHITQDDLKE